jgi:hypothetical protein
MKRSLYLLLAITGAVLLAASATGAAPPTPAVKVVNTPDEAVPVTVQGKPSVAAEQSGSWNVGVSGVVATKAADQPAFSPYSDAFTLELGSGEDFKSVALTPTTPDHPIVIEMIQISATVPPDQWPNGGIQIESGTSTRNILVPIERHGGLLPNNGKEYWIGSQLVRAYATGSITVFGSRFRDDGVAGPPGSAQIDVAIFGYRVSG